MTQMITPTKITDKQHNYLVDLAAKRSNWITILKGDLYEIVMDVLLNEQARLEKKLDLSSSVTEKFISLKNASAAISKMLTVRPDPIAPVAPVTSPTLKEAATKWIEQASAADAPTQPAAPTPLERLRRLIAAFPDGKHLKFAVKSDAGVWEFFSLDTVNSKYNEGTYRTFRKLIGAPGAWQRTPLRVTQQLPIVRRILAVGWEQAAKDYATEHGRCARCDAHLSDERSIAAKVGEHCAGEWGWPW